MAHSVSPIPLVPIVPLVSSQQRRLPRPPVRINFASIFAGIAGFDLGLERAGMRCVAQVERDKYCLSVLEKHFPHVERCNDVRSFSRSTAPQAATAGKLSLLCGGFPCQDISVAGKRAGLAGERSGLFWEFVRCVREFRPRWILLENVAGILSSNGGRDMGAVVGALAKCGYWWAYRVLDSQYFGLAQRRKRVFIVGHSGERTYPARVLFESESLPWDPPPSRQAGARVAASLTAGTASGSGVNAPGRRREDDVNLVSGQWWDGSDVTPCLDSSMLAKQQMMPEKGRFAAVIQSVTHTLRAEGHDASEDGTGRGVPLVPCVTACLNSGGGSGGFHTEPGEHLVLASESGTRTDKKPHVVMGRSGTPGSAVRRLTPRECERLQGFPDDHTAFGVDANGEFIPISNSQRYKMCGNAVSEPVIYWIGNRIIQVELELGR